MEFRTLGRTGVMVSSVGLGCEHLEKRSFETVDEVISAAIDHDINYMDMFMADPKVRDDIGQSLSGRRDKMMIQGMIGAEVANDGSTVPTRDMASTIRYYDEMLKRLKTDYIDTASIFFVDTMEAADQVLAPGGQLEYALDLKKAGKARFIGMSSHVADVSAKMIETGMIDVLMFPVNPAFDMQAGMTGIDALFDPGNYQGKTDLSLSPERARLYRACEAHGTAVVSMKTYAAGWLLKDDNYIGVKMTPAQCIHYALTRPSVASALIGCKTAEEVAAAAAYVKASEAERDFSIISQSERCDLSGKCMYCNHCLPCPSEIDVASLTRAIDLFPDAPAAAKAQYAKLRAKGSDCIECGSCMEACPFHVDVIGNMRRAVAMFEQ